MFFSDIKSSNVPLSNSDDVLMAKSNNTKNEGVSKADDVTSKRNQHNSRGNIIFFRLNK